MWTNPDARGARPAYGRCHDRRSPIPTAAGPDAGLRRHGSRGRGAPGRGRREPAEQPTRRRPGHVGAPAARSPRIGDGRALRRARGASRRRTPRGDGGRARGIRGAGGARRARHPPGLPGGAVAVAGDPRRGGRARGERHRRRDHRAPGRPRCVARRPGTGTRAPRTAPVAARAAGTGPSRDAVPAILAYDGSASSKHAVSEAAELLRRRPAIVATVWLTARYVVGAAMVAVPDEVVHRGAAALDEAARVRAVGDASEAAAAMTSAGWSCSATAIETSRNVPAGIVDAADEHDARRHRDGHARTLAHRRRPAGLKRGVDPAHAPAGPSCSSRPSRSSRGMAALELAVAVRDHHHLPRHPRAGLDRPSHTRARLDDVRPTARRSG